MLRKYESNVNVPGGDALIDISKTGVDLNWLLLGEGRMDLPSAAAPTTFTEKLGTIFGMLEQMDEERRQILTDEIFVRIREAKRLADLERKVEELIKQTR